MLPLAKSLLEFLQTGVNEGAVIFDNNGVTVNPDIAREKIAQKLVVSMKDWKPVYQGQDLLDEPTKMAGARFLAGVATSLLKQGNENATV